MNNQKGKATFSPSTPTLRDAMSLIRLQIENLARDLLEVEDREWIDAYILDIAVKKIAMEAIREKIKRDEPEEPEEPTI